MSEQPRGDLPALPADPIEELPLIPVSAGAMIFDSLGRLLILDPSYKKGWTIPGGVMEHWESPWQACRREVYEECGLTVERGRLAAVDTRPAKLKRPTQLRLLFDCGQLDDATLAGITLDDEEILAHRFVEPQEAIELLRPAVSRRVASALASPTCCYLEDGRPVAGLIP
ncbi:MAG: NUDIX hydrolase [Kineosporiaceae bacterium]|nr:NUDIX hydrolase [Kineosporiaceae bacterium]